VQDGSDAKAVGTAAKVSRAAVVATASRRQLTLILRERPIQAPCKAFMTSHVNTSGAVGQMPSCDLEIRIVLCSANAIESLNAPLPADGQSQGHFPSEQVHPAGGELWAAVSED